MYPLKPQDHLTKSQHFRQILYNSTIGFTRKIILGIWHLFYHKFLYEGWILVLEILVPIVLFYIFTFIFKDVDYKDGKGEPPHNDPIIEYYRIEDFWETFPENTQVFYSFGNVKNRASDIENMKEVMKIAIDRLKTRKGNVVISKYYESQFEMMHGIEYTRIGVEIIGVNVKQSSLTNNYISYSIQIRTFRNEWNTTHHWNGAKQGIYSYTGFTQLQSSIELAIIEQGQKQGTNQYTCGKYQSIYQIYLQVSTIEHMSSENKEKEYRKIIPLLILFSFVWTAPSIFHLIIDPRNQKDREFLKLRGHSTWMMYLEWLIYLIPTSLAMAGAVALLTIVDREKYESYNIQSFGGKDLTEWPNWFSKALLPYCELNVILVYILLYQGVYLGYILFCSKMFSSSTKAFCSSFVLWIVPWIIPLCLPNVYIPIVTKIGLSIIPSISLFYAFETLLRFQHIPLMYEWGNMTYIPEEFQNEIWNFVPLSYLMIVFVFEIPILIVAAWYLDQILKREYGIPKKWNFFLNLNFWLNKKVSIIQDPLRVLLDKQIQKEDEERFKNYQKPYPHLEPSIILDRVHYKEMLRGLTLTIYKGELTVLVGRNGCGKTALFQVLSGLWQYDGGIITVDQLDLLRSVNHIRKLIGYCSQENQFVPFMTVREHLVYFGLLQGMPLLKVHTETRKIMRAFKIYHKRFKFPSLLSYGMQRKLAVSMALISNRPILLLDEPIAGLDPKSRRHMWKVLLEMNIPNRSILIATQVLDGLEVIADRIAVMVDGHIHTYGIPAYIKKVYKSGLQLRVFTSGSTSLHHLSETIHRYIPEAMLVSATLTVCTYDIPDGKMRQLAELCEMLESKKASLLIIGAELRESTLDDIFIKHFGLSSCKRKIYFQNSEQRRARVSRIMALIIKRQIYFQQNKHEFFIIVCCALVLAIFGIICSNLYLVEHPPMQPELSFNYKDMQYPPFNGYKRSQVYYYVFKNFEAYQILHQVLAPYGVRTVRIEYEKLYNLGLFMMGYEKFNPKPENETIDSLCFSVLPYWAELGGSSTPEQFLNCSAIEFNMDNPPVHVNNASHIEPHLIKTMGDLFLRLSMFNRRTYFNVTNWPLQFPAGFKYLRDQMPDMESMRIMVIWLLVIPQVHLFVLGLGIRLPLLDRVYKVKDQELMSGAFISEYWIAHYAWDFTLYLIFNQIFLILLFVFDFSHVFTSCANVRVLWTLYLFYGLSAILYNYVWSFIFDRAAKSYYVYQLVTFSLSVFGSMYVYFRLNSEVDDTIKTAKMMRYGLSIVPHAALTLSLFQFAHLAIDNNHLHVPSTALGSDMYSESPSFLEICNPTKHLDHSLINGNNGAKISLQMMYIDIMLFSIILYGLDKKWIHHLTKIYENIAQLLIFKRRLIVPNDVSNEQKTVNYWMGLEPLFGWRLCLAVVKLLGSSIGNCITFLVKSKCWKRKGKKKHRPKQKKAPKKVKKAKGGKDEVVQIVDISDQKTPFEMLAQPESEILISERTRENISASNNQKAHKKMKRSSYHLTPQQEKPVFVKKIRAPTKLYEIPRKPYRDYSKKPYHQQRPERGIYKYPPIRPPRRQKPQRPTRDIPELPPMLNKSESKESKTITVESRGNVMSEEIIKTPTPQISIEEIEYDLPSPEAPKSEEIVIKSKSIEMIPPEPDYDEKVPKDFHRPKFQFDADKYKFEPKVDLDKFRLPEAPDLRRKAVPEARMPVQRKPSHMNFCEKIGYRVTNCFSSIINSIINAINAVINGIVKGITKLVIGVKNLIVKAIKGVGKAIYRLLVAIKTAIIKLIKTIHRAIVRTLKKIGRFIVRSIKKLGRTIKNTFKAIGRAIIKVAKKTKNLAINTVKAIVRLIKQSIMFIVKLVTKLIKAVIKALKAIVYAVIKFIKTVYKAIVKAIKSLIRVIKKFLLATIRAIKKLIKSISKAIKKLIKALIKAIKKTIKGLYKAFIKTIKAIFKLIKSIIKGLIKAVKALSKGIFKAIKRLIKLIVKSTVKLIKIVIKLIVSIVKGIVKLIKTIIILLAKFTWRLIKATVKFIKTIIKVTFKLIIKIFKIIGKLTFKLLKASVMLLRKVLIIVGKLLWRLLKLLVWKPLKFIVKLSVKVARKFGRFTVHITVKLWKFLIPKTKKFSIGMVRLVGFLVLSPCHFVIWFRKSYKLLKEIPPDPVNKPILLVYNIKKFQGPFNGQPISRVSFGLKAGESLGIISKNGEGLTTLCNILTGEKHATSGHSVLRHIRLSSNREDYRHITGYSPQIPFMDTTLTVEQNLRLHCILRTSASNDMVEEIVGKLIIRFGLQTYSDEHPQFLSTGTKRRLNLAIACIGNPTLLVLDGLCQDMDPVSKRKIWNNVSESNNQVVVFTSNDFDEMESVGQRLAIFQNGNFRCIGTLDYLRKHSNTGCVIKIRLNPLAKLNPIYILKVTLEEVFNVPVNNETPIILKLVVTDPEMASWLTLFYRMYRICSASAGLIEEYSIVDATFKSIYFHKIDEILAKVEKQKTKPQAEIEPLQEEQVDQDTLSPKEPIKVVVNKKNSKKSKNKKELIDQDVADQ